MSLIGGKPVKPLLTVINGFVNLWRGMYSLPASAKGGMHTQAKSISVTTPMVKIHPRLMSSARCG